MRAREYFVLAIGIVDIGRKIRADRLLALLLHVGFVLLFGVEIGVYRYGLLPFHLGFARLEFGGPLFELILGRALLRFSLRLRRLFGRGFRCLLVTRLSPQIFAEFEVPDEIARGEREQLLVFSDAGQLVERSAGFR